MGSRVCEDVKLDISVCTLTDNNSMAQTKISLSSPSLDSPHEAIDCSDGISGLNTQPVFVNQGLLLWNQVRQQWLGTKRIQSHADLQEPRISWNATYDSLLGTNKPFRKPIPLFEMVDFLLDMWDEEGLYD